ncbi:MAG: methionine synthase [Firmicutes bacterium]|nr:methionine synthase [Bacillota bacterium]
MKLTVPRSLRREEWLNYLHVDGEPDDALRRQMDEAERLLLGSVRPRGIYRVLSRSQVPEDGFSIQKHLEGCDQSALLAVTAGTEIDALIRKWQTAGMAMALLLDTGASVLVEQIADEAEAQLEAEITARAPGRFFTPRFSPGYGDYPLSCQRDLLTLVDAPRKIGLTLTAGNMMVPSKSITALIGLSDVPVKGRLATCGECVLREKCEFIKTGGHC